MLYIYESYQFMIISVDSEVADLSQYFERACGFINDAREHGHAVLVHCQQGVSRSASIIIAYLIKHGVCTIPFLSLQTPKHDPLI
jgi:protein-tyrosine phosphatase